MVLIDPRYDSRPLDALVSQMHYLNGEQCARLIKHTVAYVEPLRDFVLGSPTLVALAANPDQLTAAHHEEIVDAVLGAKDDDCQAVAIACLASGTFPLDSYHERIVNALRKFSMQSAKCTAVIGLAPTLSAASTALNELLVDFAINIRYPDMRSAAIVALAARMSALGGALGMSLVDATMDLPEDLKAPAIAALGDQVDVLGAAQGDRLVDAAYGLRDEGELATALTGLVRGEEFMSERARERVVRLWMRLTDDKLKAEVLAAYC